jgi:hypothetical protein
MGRLGGLRRVGVVIAASRPEYEEDAILGPPYPAILGVRTDHFTQICQFVNRSGSIRSFVEGCLALPFTHSGVAI